MFLAENIKLQSYRAIKRIKKDDELYHELMNEVTILKNLKHSNIPVIYDIEEDKDYSYIIEEYVQGQSLKAYRLCQGNICEDIIIKFAIQICDLFQYLHTTEKPILYLDLKPDNIIVSEGILKLIDFGTAVYYDELKKRKVSLGTKGYAAPEQYGMHTPDQRSDIYGLGVLLYFLATGDLTCGIGRNIDNPNIKKEYSKQLIKIIYKCVKYYPAQRYQTIVQLKNKLVTLQAKTKKAKPLLSDASLIIAIAGAQRRIGTTHIAFLITSYLNYYNDTAVYVENNDNLVIQSILKNYNNSKLNDELLKIYYCPMYKQNPYSNKGCLVKYRVQVCDYGVLCDANVDEFLKADIKLMVLGVKAWELPFSHQRLKIFPEYEEIRYLFNFADTKTYCNIEKYMKKNKCIRVPYQANPFYVKNNEIIRDFVEECFEEYGYDKKACFTKGISLLSGRKD